MIAMEMDLVMVIEIAGKKTASFLGFGFGGDRDQIPPLGKLVANTPCKVAMQIVIVSVVLLKLILNDSDCIP